MALIRWCKECGRQLSDKAFICPSCGAPVGSGGKEINPVKSQPAKSKKVKKKKSSSAGIIAFLLIVIVALLIGIGVYAYSNYTGKDAENDSDPQEDEILVELEIDGHMVDIIGQRPVVVDGVILAPVDVFEPVGYTVVWDKNTGKAILSNGLNTIIIEAQSYAFTTNGETYDLPASTQMFDDDFMVPIEAVMESVGYFVAWDDAANTVIISTTVPVSAPEAAPEDTAVQSTQAATQAASGQTQQATSKAASEQTTEAASKTVQESATAQADSGTTIKFKDTSDVIIIAGETITRKATATPSGKITYQSSDPSVASVDKNGKVTAKNMGETKITASSGGSSASYNVTVLVMITISAIEVHFEQNYDVDLLVGETFTRKATATPAGSISYQSSDSSVATVSSSGKVTARRPGNARITAYSDDDSASYNVTVIAESSFGDSTTTTSQDTASEQETTPEATVPEDTD